MSQNQPPARVFNYSLQPMNARTHALQAAAKRLSGLDRRRTLGVIMATIGAIAVSAGVITQPAAADESYRCPDGNFSQWRDTFDPPAAFVTTGPWYIVYVGFGVESGGHVQIGDGVTNLGSQTFDVIAIAGEPATDAHYCKEVEEEPTTTIQATTTTQPEVTTTTTQPEVTTTTQPEVTTTTQPEVTTTTQPEVTTTTQPEVTTTTAAPTTTTESSVAESTTTSVQIAPPTTTTTTIAPTVPTVPPTTTAGSVSQELPRTGTDSARALMTFGSLMMLMGGVLVLRSRRDVEFS